MTTARGRRRLALAWFLHRESAGPVTTEETTMKAGYLEAAWRLFQPSLVVRPGHKAMLTWADMELAGTPFGRPVPLPVVRIRGDHDIRARACRQDKGLSR